MEKEAQNEYENTPQFNPWDDEKKRLVFLNFVKFLAQTHQRFQRNL